MRAMWSRVVPAAAMVLLGAGGAALAAHDRSALKVPDGLSFSEFKGYVGWEAVAVSQTEHGLKLIAANPVMMRAYRAGLPAAGKQFPEGSKIVKVEWTSKRNTASPYFVMVPDALTSLSFIEKDSKRFPKTNGWAYAKFQAEPASGALEPVGTGTDCGHACHAAAVAAQDFIFTAYPRR
ncbi:MAG: cytochrome P460 family protein [Phenylobacterium sp.]